MTIALADAIGRWVACPDPGCGATSFVQESRSARPRPGGIPAPMNLGPGAGPPPPDTSRHWCAVLCPRTGPKLFPAHTPVEVIDG